ncbi:class A beta-lactamase [Nocardiopsis sp. TSRI0078]|uniref:class A beta-lactamase n=1 Tax=unclassified Nocardiopsis TaxID=2649073 RepID=UPI00093E4A2F|nr:class A beta-lactamase [Nocardiopsis sp. TSRI0078]OKI12268.1 class A beta-lactamase [Nocardiopsis sp. TSRI0078]
MPWSTTRHAALAALAPIVLVPLTGCSPSADPAGPAASPPSAEAAGTSRPAEPPAPIRMDPEFERLEEEFDVRLGVHALDTGTDQVVEFQADERFAYCSTFKALAFGAVLDRTPVDELDRVVTFSEEDLVFHSPVTREHVADGMTLREIGDAALRHSDNTASNLLIEELGGPEGLEEALRGIGDDVTRVDRVAPEMAQAVPGDVRDTSTPRAMTASLRAFALDDVLPEDRRGVLVDMMRANTTGDDLIRAGAPEGWTVGDKTGACGYGTRHDIGVLWPPEGDPVVLAVMSSRDEAGAQYDDALIARATELAVGALD